ncbi:MAG: TatD family hydrolase [Pseudomonadota bacterium]
MLTLTDIGANLADASFDKDRDDVIARARSAGVTRMIITGSSIDSNVAAAELATAQPGLGFTAGVHPHHAKDLDDAALQTLRGQMAHPKINAAGECGLDYFRNLSDKQQQADAFAKQLDLAIEHQLPVFLHQRDAHDDFMAILKPRLGELTRAVAHCFTAGERELDDYLAHDLYIGITGWICDERRGKHLLDLVPRIPAERLMIESDAPYLMPRSLRPKPDTRRNEPCWLTETARVVAQARNQSVEDLASQTNATASQFFNLPE